jgi:glycosyltransferase involved in cell wall biosynthesis
MHFDRVSLLITHYNRSNSLLCLLEAWKQLGITFNTIVVSDDGSKPEHLGTLERLKEQGKITLVTTPLNKGLAHNINKGQQAITTPYTLYVQEDFIPTEKFPAAFGFALDYLENKQEIDVARFYAYFKFPFLKSVGNGFSQMIFNPSLFLFNNRRFFMYSDHPHLRRSNFLQKFGPYEEGKKSDVTEYTMMIRFLQKGGNGIFYDDYKALFNHVNTTEEATTVTRSSIRYSNNIFIKVVRDIYRYIKFNYHYRCLKMK